jgi:thiamine biosynthesis protein ThiS
MKIKVNGDPMELASGSTVKQLIEQLGLGAGPVAVERNGLVVKRAEHGNEVLADGDAVEVVHFVGGG